MPGPWEGDLTTVISVLIPQGEFPQSEVLHGRDLQEKVLQGEVHKELIPQGEVLSILDYPTNTTTLGNDNQTGWGEIEGSSATEAAVNWWGLVAILVVLLTLFGNILLILAISWDRRLQNMTNYFLLSLAVTDLMVASLVMPLSIVILVLGHFPFSSRLCLVWISLDVLFCTASIMHLCTLSVDRFLSLRYPMKFGRHKTRRRVVLKIVLVWCLSLAASLPLSLMYAADTHSTIVDGVCQIPVSLFQIIGSIICFYIPLIIMLVTYALTVRLLSKKQSELQGNVMEPSSATPSPRSVRWKKFLCKTTSNLSTSTAVSITDGDISETGCGGLETRCEDSKLRRFGSSPLRRPPLVRYTSHHYRAALARGGACGRRGYSARERNREVTDAGAEDRLYPPLPGNPSFELTVFPQGSPDRPRSAPTSTTTSPRHRRHRSDGISSHSQPDSQLPFTEKDLKIQGTQNKNSGCEQNGGPRRRETQEECNDEYEGPDSGEHVAVPCSCAPRFFLEDIKNTSNSQCQECIDPRLQEVTTQYRSNQHRQSQESGSRQRAKCWTGCCRRKGNGTTCCCPCPCLIGCFTKRQNGSQAGMPALSSPWNEESSTSRGSDIVTRATLRPGGQVTTTMLHKPPSVESSSVTSSPGSSRGLWRQQSCTASIKYVNSKKHGRNIRMEQKATKVLGVVFFTFVLLWAPFFIANVLISCGADMGEDVINFVTWLGYASSMANPFFYTFFNKTFRQTFLKIIKCEMKRSQRYHL